MQAIERLLTPKEYADIRRCSIRTTERERERCDGCPYVQMGRRIYYRREDVEQFISAHVRRPHQTSADPHAEGVLECTRDEPAASSKPSQLLGLSVKDDGD